jgi:hypothetical protein
MKKAAVKAANISSTKSYWTIKDAARYINVHASTLYAWLHPEKQVKKGRPPGSAPPPAYRFGKHAIRIPIDEFKQWAEQCRQEGT